jgi:flagellar basal-body rod protein FlgC
MKIGGNLPGFNISAEGLSVQRKKMNLIAENIANADSVRSEDGQPYKRKFLKIVQDEKAGFANTSQGNSTLRLAATQSDHFSSSDTAMDIQNPATGLSSNELTDQSTGEVLYMPESPDANGDGYVEKSNVNIITEMTDMIAATRSYEANLTALNSSKQMAKDALEI